MGRYLIRYSNRKLAVHWIEILYKGYISYVIWSTYFIKTEISLIYRFLRSLTFIHDFNETSTVMNVTKGNLLNYMIEQILII